jgi:hypothetical protein
MSSTELQAAYGSEFTPLREVVGRRLVSMVHEYWNKDMPPVEVAEEDTWAFTN